MPASAKNPRIFPAEFEDLQANYNAVKNMSVQLLQKIPQPSYFLQAVQVGQEQEASVGIDDVQTEFIATHAILDLSSTPISPGTSTSTIICPEEKLSGWRTTISKKKLCNLQKLDKKWGRLQKTIKAKHHRAKPLSHRIFGTAVSRTGVSLYNAEILFSASVCAFLHNAGLDSAAINMEIAQSFTPSRATFCEFIVETAAEKLGWLREKVVGLDIFLGANKGHKKG